MRTNITICSHLISRGSWFRLPRLSSGSPIYLSVYTKITANVPKSFNSSTHDTNLKISFEHLSKYHIQRYVKVESAGNRGKVADEEDTLIYKTGYARWNMFTSY